MCIQIRSFCIGKVGSRRRRENAGILSSYSRYLTFIADEVRHKMDWNMQITLCFVLPSGRTSRRGETSDFEIASSKLSAVKGYGETYAPVKDGAFETTYMYYLCIVIKKNAN